MSQVMHKVVIFWSIGALLALDECFFDGCRCVKNIDYSYDIICVNQNNSLFPKRLKSNITRTINTFLLKQYLFTEIPDGTFQGLAIRHLIIGENRLKKIGPDTFRGIKSLSLLKIIEKNFETIDLGAFDPISYYLSELGIWQINYQSHKIDEFFAELKKLKSLKTLSLMGYGLKQFKPEWTTIFESIVHLNLASNEMKSIGPDIFKSCKHIESINLNNNFMSNLSSIFRALEPVKSKLRELKLASNQISQLKDFSAFARLEALDLSNNQIKKIPTGLLKGLDKLNSLYLSSNLIRSLPDSLFSSVPALSILMLDNNYLSTVPSVRTLSNLKILDLSNQNGNLKELEDFLFERANSTCCLYLNLDANRIEKYGKKTFCSRDSGLSEIRKLDLSYQSMANMDHCLLSQLRSDMANKIEFYVTMESEISKESTVSCNCELKSFLKSLKIGFIGPCSDVAGPCNEYQQTQQCDKQFQC
ncbi:insulin-like growth factor-binding complex acid labile subunit [Brachionus plicatilis]|uniref:Insulin-like growth factor-binding complex acid labile subunit n=1 Tax=Brachionus plicatilis TaxID=10195 RepID=A0A3M7Q868_BRAPC|nr:insulin-like growth factor-binding complex acid labile subunit [Brachionus plicatilis]